MKKIPTDLDILDAIYRSYYDEFCNYSEDDPKRSSKIFVPVDLQRIARQLDVDSEIVFGRLYYDLENRYGFKTGDNASVSFFAMKVGGDRHAINFPYMTSVLAVLREENRKYRIATTMAFVSLGISIISFSISVFSNLV